MSDSGRGRHEWIRRHVTANGRTFGMWTCARCGCSSSSARSRGPNRYEKVLVRVGGDWESGGKWVPLMCDEATAARVTES